MSMGVLALVEVKTQAEAGTEDEPVFSDLLLVGWLIEQFFEMIVLAVFVAIITETPHGVLINCIADAAGEADLEGAAQADGIPEEPHHRIDRKPGAPECQRGIV